MIQNDLDFDDEFFIDAWRVVIPPQHSVSRQWHAHPPTENFQPARHQKHSIRVAPLVLF